MNRDRTFPIDTRLPGPGTYSRQETSFISTDYLYISPATYNQGIDCTSQY